MFSGELVEVLKDKAAVASPLYRRLLLDAAKRIDELEIKISNSVEECARVCDSKYELRRMQGFAREASAARALAKEIRELKRKSTR